MPPFLSLKLSEIMEGFNIQGNSFKEKKNDQSLVIAAGDSLTIPPYSVQKDHVNTPMFKYLVYNTCIFLFLNKEGRQGKGNGIRYNRSMVSSVNIYCCVFLKKMFGFFSGKQETFSGHSQKFSHKCILNRHSTSFWQCSPGVIWGRVK